MSKLLKFEVHPRHLTDRGALLFFPELKEEIWLPLSQCELYVSDEDRDIYILELPEWLAIEKELI